MITTATGTLSTTRRPNSTSGNASFSVVFVFDFGDETRIVQGVTAPNSQFTTTMPRDGRATCTWHTTPSGRVIFDNITA